MEFLKFCSSCSLCLQITSFWRREVEDQCFVDSLPLPWVRMLALAQIMNILMATIQFIAWERHSQLILHTLPHLSSSLSLLRVVFADFFVMNLILWGEGSSAAMPFGTLVAILALWFCISVPLTFIGAYFGFKKAVSKCKHTYFASSHAQYIL